MREKLFTKEIAFRKDSKRSWNEPKLLKKSSSSGINSGFKMQAWFLVIVGFLLASLFIVNNIISAQFRVAHFTNATQDNNVDDQLQQVPNAVYKKPGFLVRNKGCRIADLDPLDEFSKRFMQVEKPIECEFGSQLPLVESNDTFLFINKDSIGQYYNSTETVNCCWRSFERKKGSDNIVKFNEFCHKFKNSARMIAEFVKVECFKGEKRIYRDYHFFVPRKEKVEERCQLLDKQATDGSQRRKLSLLVVGLDSISRLNFHRMMPRTVHALKKHGAIEMLGYNKVGDNTYPNLVPVLTGLSEAELGIHCWNDTSKPFDNCPFLWKNFSASGYRTVFAEDACAMTTFNYLKPGFHIQPTDYYFRPYCVAAENDIGNTHKLNANLCVGTRLTYQNLLNYTKRVVREFANDLFFGFFWEASLTHDFFNYPQLADDTYQEAIEYFFRDDLLNNTALIVMSDHGIRWGEFRQTFQGRIEGSLPFVFTSLPDWWKKEYPIAWANFRRNSASLTTPFDLHETISDLLDSKFVTEKSIRKRTKLINEMNNENIPRGMSWFLPIPDHRTCDMAGIPGHWCMCHKSNDISIKDNAVRNATSYLVTKLNKMLKKYPQCAGLELKTILDAKIWNQGDNQNGIAPWTDYTVTIQTLPGNAIFEGSIRRTADKNSNTLVGSISRLNAYGKQSACVDDFNMRLYCYCR